MNDNSADNDYSKTLFLPETQFPMRAGLPQKEPELLAHWKTHDLYGKVLDCAFIGWIRPELKFDTLEALVSRMNEDSQAAKLMLAASGDAFPPLGRI